MENVITLIYETDELRLYKSCFPLAAPPAPSSLPFGVFVVLVLKRAIHIRAIVSG